MLALQSTHLKNIPSAQDYAPLNIRPCAPFFSKFLGHNPTVDQNRGQAIIFVCKIPLLARALGLKAKRVRR